MGFQDVNDEFNSLRHLARMFVGENALGEISVRPPANDDEASFLRLVSWSYALVFEVGRVTIPYLLRLPSSLTVMGADYDRSCEVVHDLRTWCSHNLGFEDERDMTTHRRVTLWFIDNCGVAPPSSSDDWTKCFESLCLEVCSILKHCRGAMSLMLTQEEGSNDIIDDLVHRLDRNWPASKFDEIVSDAAARIGESLDVCKFRRNKLERWRQFLDAVPEDDDPYHRIVRLIERDVLDHFESVLPIDGHDVMTCLGLAPGPKVREALTTARRLFKQGVRDRDELLDKLVEGHRSDSKGLTR